MKKLPIWIIAILMVCSLTYVGILAYTPYSYNNPYDNLGTQIIDFSKPLQDFANTLTRIGNAGYTSLSLAGIIPMATQLYILTFDVSITIGSDVYESNAYLVVYSLIDSDVSSFDRADLHKIYAFCDAKLPDNSYMNRMNFYIKDARCEYYQRTLASGSILTQENLVRMDKNYPKYGDNVISVTSQDLIFNINRENLNTDGLTYTLVDCKPFDMSQMYSIDLIFLY